MKKYNISSIIAVVTIVLMCISSNTFAFGTNKFKAEVEKEAAAVKLYREVVRGDYKILTTSELQDVIKNQTDYLIIDTMPYEASYKKGHIPGAVQFLFPIPEMQDWVAKENDGKSMEDYLKLLGSDKDKKIIVYCGFVKCTRSHNGAMWARRLGYTNVYRHPGGIYAWKGAGYTIEK